jgi:hypothetical protein
MINFSHDYECMTCGVIIPAGTYYWDQRIFKKIREGRLITPIAVERLTIPCPSCVDEEKVETHAQRRPEAWKCHTCGAIIPDCMPQWSISCTKNRHNLRAYEPAYEEILRTWCDHCANSRDLLPESKIFLNKLLTPNTPWVRTYQKTFRPSQHRFSKHCGTKQ